MNARAPQPTSPGAGGLLGARSEWAGPTFLQQPRKPRALCRLQSLLAILDVALDHRDRAHRNAQKAGTLVLRKAGRGVT